MQTSVTRCLLLSLSVAVFAGCAGSDATAPRANAAASAQADDDDELDGESAEHAERQRRALERRNHRLQKQLLSDMQRLLNERGGAASDEPPKLLVFGGKHHEVYLGCLCDRHQADSVFNLAGEYGSDASATSLRNKFTPYGSITEDTSVCNAAASRPPSVVASDGKSLGLLTVNPALKKRIDVPSVADWLARMCRQ